MVVVSAATLTKAEVPAVAAGQSPVRAPGFGAAGPDVLAYAAHVLPLVAHRRPFSGDVHAALFEALNRLGVGTDRYHRLRLADEATDMLAVYLVAAGRAAPQARTSKTIRGWLVCQDLAGVGWALLEAACFWRRELDPLAGVPGVTPLWPQPAESTRTEEEGSR